MQGIKNGLGPGPLNTVHWRAWWEAGTLFRGCWACRTVQPLWRTDPEIPFLGIYWREIKRHINTQDWSKYVSRRSVHDSSELETTRSSIRRGVDKQIGVCSHRGHFHTRRTNYSHIHVRESQKHCAEQKKPDTKELTCRIHSYAVPGRGGLSCGGRNREDLPLLREIYSKGAGGSFLGHQKCSIF